MLVKQTPWLVPPRARVAPETDNRRIALTAQQISQIAQIFDDPTVEDELAKARTAWMEYQSSRKRDAIYGYLDAVFQIVSLWKKQKRAKTKSNQALAASNQTKAIKIEEPFSIVIYCASDPHRVDAKTRSKWARALRYAERFKPDTQSLAQFVKNKGGVNECAAQWSDQ